MTDKKTQIIKSIAYDLAWQYWRARYELDCLYDKKNKLKYCESLKKAQKKRDKTYLSWYPLSQSIFNRIKKFIKNDR